MAAIGTIIMMIVLDVFVSLPAKKKKKKKISVLIKRFLMVGFGSGELILVEIIWMN
jgi:hypothetical protein